MNLSRIGVAAFAAHAALLVAMLAWGCSTDPTTVRQTSATQGVERGSIMAILRHLEPGQPPVTHQVEMMGISPASTVAADDVTLILWHDPATGTIWVQQSGGFPGVDLWFGPGPASLLTPPAPALLLRIVQN
jgi:hypothetical protein